MRFLPRRWTGEDFFSTAEELRLRRRKRNKYLSFASAVLVLTALGYFGARPAHRAVEAWQARRHAANAFHLIDEEKWSEARNEAVSALQLSRTEPQALRAVARFLWRTHQAEALEFWKELAAQQPLTREDLRDETSAALAAGNAALAESALQELLSVREGGPAAADWLLRAQVSAQKGDAAEETKALDRVLADPKATERQLLQASLLQIGATGTDASAIARKIQDAAWTRLTNISQSKNAAGLDALMLLAQRALSSPNDDNAAHLADELENHPSARTPQKLLATDLRIHAAPNEKEALIDAAIARWKDADNATLADLAKWLNGKNEFAKELAAVPPGRALQTRELFLQHVDALGALNRWDEIRRLLQNEKFPLDPVTTQMYLARCDAQLGNKTASANGWQRALEAAGRDPQKLLTLADYADKNGAANIAAQAGDAAVAAAPTARPAWQEKLRLVQATRDTTAIRGVLAAMQKIWPNDRAIQNDQAYLRALQLPNDGSADDELKSLRKIATTLVQVEPLSLPHRTLLALVDLKLLRPTAALEVYRGINVAATALTPSALAVHAAVLAANGQPADAQKEIAQLSDDRLLAEEAQLLAPLRDPARTTSR